MRLEQHHFAHLRKVLPQVGEVMLFEAHWDRFRPDIKHGWREEPQPGAGVLSDLGPHMIDQALALFGIPDAIGADVLAQRENAKVDDYFDVALHYGQRRVRLTCSTLVAQPRPRFAVHGTAGSFVKYGLDPQEAQLKAGMDPRSPEYGIDPQEALLRAGGSPRDPGYGVEAPEHWGVFTNAAGSEPVATERGDWGVFYRGVADAVIDGAPPPVDTADAVAGLSIIDCARRSASEGRVLGFTAPG